MTSPADSPQIKEAHKRADMIWRKQEDEFTRMAAAERQKSAARNASPSTQEACLAKEGEYLACAEYCRTQMH